MKKSFFRERTAREIQKLNVKQIFRHRGLAERIIGLHPDLDGIEIRTQITPRKFFFNPDTGRYNLTGEQASKKCLSHGHGIDLTKTKRNAYDYNEILLNQPQLQKEAYEYNETLLQIMARSFSELQNMKEEEINFVRYSFRPVQGSDMTKRVIPFVYCPQGLKKFGYAENIVKDEAFEDENIESDGIEVETFKKSKRVKKEGANVLAKVPSTTKKKPRYKVKLLHVPIIRGYENLASVLSLKPGSVINEETGEPEISRTPHEDYNIRYTFASDREGSEVITLYPHYVTTYIGVIKDQNEKHNLVPYEMCPFILLSKKGAEYCNKLDNNIVIFDKTLSKNNNPKQLRKLHLDEKCIMIARGIHEIGYDDFSWNPERDGKLKDYDWSV